LSGGADVLPSFVSLDQDVAGGHHPRRCQHNCLRRRLRTISLISGEQASEAPATSELLAGSSGHCRRGALGARRRTRAALRCDGHCDHQLDRNVGATSLQSVTSDVPGIGLNLEMLQVGAYSQRTVGSETCSGVALSAWPRAQRSALHRHE